MADKRHLKVIPNAEPVDAFPARSAMAWFALAVLLVVVLWLPLGMLGIALSRAGIGLLTWAQGSPSKGMYGPGLLPAMVGVLPIVLSFGLAAYMGGIMLVRFGLPQNASHGAWVGVIAAALIASLALVGGSLRPWFLGVAAYIALTLTGALSGALGGRSGQKLRKAANLSALAQPAGQSRALAPQPPGAPRSAPNGNEDA